MRPIDPGRLPVDEEHPQLSEATRPAIELLVRLRQAVQPAEGGAAWLQHYEFTDRAWHLADHVNSALDDADQARYASAFGTLRTAMEHGLTDRLLLLAERYFDDIETVTNEQFAEVEERAAGMPDVISVERRGNGARLVRKGHDVTNEEGEVVEQISPYWHVLKHHDATIGPPTIQEKFASGIIDVEQLKDHAQHNASLHSRYLKWEAILRNLVLNGLIAPEHDVRLEVHYRWLSAFAHSTQTGYDIVERECGHPSWGVRKRSHLLGELVLLYAATFAAAELHSFCEFVDKRPQLIELSNRAEIEAAIGTVRLAAAYFWWPGSAPSVFDRVTEANHRVWREFQRNGRTNWPAASDPASIPDEEVGYYPDPYERLKSMHQGGVEVTTGLGHRPPWS